MGRYHLTANSGSARAHRPNQIARTSALHPDRAIGDTSRAHIDGARALAALAQPQRQRPLLSAPSVSTAARLGMARNEFETRGSRAPRGRRRPRARRAAILHPIGNDYTSDPIIIQNFVSQQTPEMLRSYSEVESSQVSHACANRPIPYVRAWISQDPAGSPKTSRYCPAPRACRVIHSINVASTRVDHRTNFFILCVDPSRSQS
ncbi:hypothetical protein EVAR_43594_1 [Eumeta japonica]|uniref:Uncharacterized protein n=1 Tax=Eumeta variegata TaxID=151549 RepID=A0A4C1XHG7_EUMVA|nr:hypothetical protein EVAR_43594_1 [Eumeta japonica]